MKKAPKAYKNADFLTSPEARTIRMLSEYMEPESRFNKYAIEDTIVFFGSARIESPARARELHEELSRQAGNGPVTVELEARLRKAKLQVKNSRYYEDARQLALMITSWSKELRKSRRSSNRRFIICSGGGGGIMEAANRGASEAGGYSIGLNISLPYEQEPNPYISRELMFEFHYFFMRKFWLAYMAKALVIFPGGYGTMDEMMELLTLLQTGKINRPLQIIIYGNDYWREVLNFDAMVRRGMISPEDLELFCFCDTPEEAFQCLKNSLEPLLQPE